MSFDLERLLRTVKPEKLTLPIYPQRETSVLAASAQPGTGATLLLDTTVYIDNLQGRLPPEAERLVQQRHAMHSPVCIAELTHQFGRLDPADPRTPAVLNNFRAVLAAIPARRISPISSSNMALAGILSGTLQRLHPTQGFPHRYLNDAMIYAQAAGAGLHVLTRNHGDFALFNHFMKKQIVIGY